ncbi:uncharacterized protein BDV14DRAFT_203051 [Aspergillus stella-maris]|uniref:uncharacterized protein n=1 Tax=Aspergillus stella-maris TaxID=1810926 RepID=UPI003CCCA496
MIVPNLLKHHLVLTLLFSSVFAATSTQAADVVKDAPPSETSPTAPTCPKTVENCNRWYTAKKDDNCDGITRSFGIFLDDFYKWNPSLKKNCDINFWAEYAYCVATTSESSTSSSGSNTSSSGESITITSSSGSSTRPTATPSGSTLIVSSSSSVPVIPTTGSATGTYTIINPITSFTPTPRPSPTDDTWPPTHTQPGQPDACYKWHHVQRGDTCGSIQARYAAWLSLEELLEWNPSLAADCNYPFLGWWVCVASRRDQVSYDYPTQNSTQLVLPEPTSYNATILPTDLPTFVPSPTQSGLAPSCQAYYQAENNDNCTTIIEQYYYLTEDLLHDWNPALEDDCSGLRDQFYYCVDAFPLDEAPMPPTVTTAPSPIANGDFGTCPLLALRFGTFDVKDFIAWNSAVGKNCEKIMPDTWYCVGIRDTPTTRTEPFPTVLPKSLYPRQPNIIKTCTFFWPVELGETCEAPPQTESPSPSLYSGTPTSSTKQANART